jgi:two-component system OmpR family response regulator
MAKKGCNSRKQPPYDGAVVNVMLPKLEGISVVQRLRAKGGRVPVVFLSARATVEDR